MNKKILVCSLAAALVAGGFIATKAFAADSTGSTSAAHARFMQRIADKLGLTGDQRTQIKALIVGDKTTLAPLLSGLHEARKDLRTAIQAGDANESSVRVAAAKVAAVEADLAVERMKLYGEIAPILTAEQRQEAADLEQRADDFIDGAIARFSGMSN